MTSDHTPGEPDAPQLPGDCACVVLTGGRSSRMGRDKATLPLGARTLLEHVVARVAPLVREVVVVAAAAQVLPPTAARVVRDDVPELGPLPALAAGLGAVTTPWAFALACDAAFVRPELLRALVAEIGAARALIPRWGGRLQPLVALYSRALAPEITALAASGERRLQALATLAGVRIVEDDRLAPHDPDGESFAMLNTPEEYAHALGVVARDCFGQTGVAILDRVSEPTIVREPARALGADVEVERVAGGTSTRVTDVVAVEEPLEIRLHGWRWLVTMRTPGDDADLIVGLLASEGVIAGASDVESVLFTRHPDEPDLANVADVRLVHGLGDVQARLARNQVLAASSCGLCGKSTVEALLARSAPLPDGPLLDPALLGLAPAVLAGAQPAFRATGGLHAAALLDATGTLLVAREDVGRHNAVDKALGWRLRAGDAGRAACILVVSGRASFEIVQKALAARMPAIAAVSAPSSLAVTLARDANLTLAGFVRDGGYNVYTGSARLRPTAAARRDASAAGAAAAGTADPLEFIPTIVRRALDGIAQKISLVDWQALTLAERARLVALASAGDGDAFAARLTADVVARTGRAPRPLGAPKAAP